MSNKGDQERGNSKSARLYIPPVYFRITITRVRIEDAIITVGQSLGIKLTQDTANVKSILETLEKEHGVSAASSVLLDANFCQIYPNKLNQGELFWNNRSKYYVADRSEWNEIVVKEKAPLWSQVSYRKVIHPIQSAPRLKSSLGVGVLPLTQPKMFRRAFTQLYTIDNRIIAYKNRPLDLQEYVANVESIKKLLAQKYKMKSPIILDTKYMILKDRPNNRGEQFWNTEQVFFFIEKSEWQDFLSRKENNRKEKSQQPARQPRTLHRAKSLALIKRSVANGFDCNYRLV